MTFALATGNTPQPMPSPYYVQSTERAHQVDRLFTSIARRYDCLNDLQSFGLHRLWKSLLVKRVKPRPNDIFLDLCCGTGDIAFQLAQRQVQVLAVDFNRAMLETAQQRAIHLPARSHLTFIQADALNLPFPDDSFDGVTVGYGLRNLADIPRALGEIWRLLKPGGRLGILDFGRPPNALWRQLYFTYLKIWVPQLGRWVGGDAAAYEYILESLLHYPAQEGVVTALKQCGAGPVAVTNLIGGVMSLHTAMKK